MVSPENSEDGSVPLIADGKYFTVPSVALPHNPASTFPGQARGMQLMDAKRRKTEDGIAVVANGSAPGASAAPASRGRKKNQAQIDRRRERNRVLARRTRLRKKFFFESLQKEVTDLQAENLLLKELVKLELDPEVSSQIIAECDAAEKLPAGVLEVCGENSNMNSQDFSLVQSIQKSQHSFVITDPSLQDNPIVFASDDFLKVTGYSREQVLGRNCRFLQGEETSEQKVKAIRKALEMGEDVTQTIVNYTADGTPFWNKLFIAALRDAENNIVNYIGVTVEVACPEPGDPEEGKVLEGAKGQVQGQSTAESTLKAMEKQMEAAIGS